MSQISRRCLLAGSFGILRGSVKKTDIRIEEISHAYEDYLYRTPIKFGGSVVDRRAPDPNSGDDRRNG